MYWRLSVRPAKVRFLYQSILEASLSRSSSSRVDLHAEAAVDVPADHASDRPEGLEVDGDALFDATGNGRGRHDLLRRDALQPAGENLYAG